MPYVTTEWLSEHVDIDPRALSVEDLAAALVKVGLEEEAIHPGAVQGPLVCGRVLTMNPEPQSNGKVINYCRVDVGQYNDAPGTGKEPSELPSRGIICGAHNFQEGDYVVVSLPGAVLPGPFPISARKTYGHVSDGMICSERELGMGQEHDGIIVLQKKFPEAFGAGTLPKPGESVIEFLELGGEKLEINITPDRGYCFSMRGVAREYAHSTGVKFTDPGLLDVPAPTSAGIPVWVRDEAPIRGQVGCDRFVTRVIKGVDVNAPTPKWMVRRLEAAGMRSLSLPVDVTNYVMLDLGQPLHAYDLDVVGAGLGVRRARAGEKFVTLDEVERELDPEDLLVVDGADENVLALAGVMGGARGEITPTTTNILLEAAHFEPISIARSARRHRLHTEAAKRYERGVDPQLAPHAAQRVVDLLCEFGGGVDAGCVFDYDAVRASEPIEFNLGEAERLIGVSYAPERVCELLRLIGCEVKPGANAQTVLVSVPSWRPDLTGPAHLVEEVARLDGYERIPSVKPATAHGQGLSLAQKARRDAARSLAEAGLVQVLSYPFVNESVFERQLLDPSDPRRVALRLANPLAEDAPFMRTSILDTLLSVAERNVARGNADFAIYETGMVTRPAGTKLAGRFGIEGNLSNADKEALAAATPAQPRHVAGVLCGLAERDGVLSRARAYDWADAVQAVRMLCSTLGVSMQVSNTDARVGLGAASVGGDGSVSGAASVAPFHPGRCARVIVRGKCVGLAGQLHPSVVAAFHLPACACAFELDLDQVCAAVKNKDFQVRALSTFPLAKEDLALVVDEEVPAANLQSLIEKQCGDLLEECRLFDVFRGPQLGEGKKSLAFSLQLRSPQGTLKAAEIAQLRAQIVKSAQKKFKAELRG